MLLFCRNVSFLLVTCESGPEYGFAADARSSCDLLDLAAAAPAGFANDDGDPAGTVSWSVSVEAVSGEAAGICPAGFCPAEFPADPAGTVAVGSAAYSDSKW